MPFLGKTPSQIVDPEVDIDGGTIDGVSIGSVTADAGAFTNLTATGTLTLPDDGISGDDVNGGTISNFASTGIDDNATSTAITIASSGLVNLSGSIEATTAYRAYDSVGALYRNVLRYSNGNVRLETGSNGTEAITAFTASQERMRIDSAGNVGIGVAPESWNTYTPVQVQQASLSSFTNGDARLTNNAYYNGGWKYIDSRPATQYLMDASNGIHTWSTTASGTADGAITWAERMRIDNDGYTNIKVPFTTSMRLMRQGATSDAQTSGIVFGNDFSTNGLGILASAQTGFRFKSTTDTSSTGPLGSAISTDLMTIKASGNVGIGTTNPSSNLTVVEGSSGSSVVVGEFINTSSAVNGTGAKIWISGRGDSSINRGAYIEGQIVGAGAQHHLIFATSASASAPTERMRIDSSGNLMLGKDQLSIATAGVALLPNGEIYVTRDSGPTAYFNREGSDGAVIFIRSNNTNVGAINTRANQLAIGCTGTGLEFNDSNDAIIPFSPNANNTRDNALDLGMSGVRFNDAYITNGVTSGSDERLKQEIAELDEAETRVALACKGLLRKWRWKDAVEKKDNNPDSDEVARIHFGIIAQELKAAFEAEGLDAGRYGMFIHSTWTDEETGEERDRMGIRYSELLAFIVAAI